MSEIKKVTNRAHKLADKLNSEIKPVAEDVQEFLDGVVRSENFKVKLIYGFIGLGVGILIMTISFYVA